jgi:carbon-monoxide dehydrogenase medium subunit
MRRFEYFEPRTLPEAAALLAKGQGKTGILAGGTDLLVEIKEHIRQPEYVVNIKHIPELLGLHYDPVAGLRVGALATARAVETCPVVIERYAGLAQGAQELGSIQVRNRATIVGNLCRASPSADTAPPLMADEARIRIFGLNGERELALEDFFTGPGKTVLVPGEIAIELRVPAPPSHTGKIYIKHGRRKAMELATVGVAVALTLADGVCRQARIVLGAVAPTPIRVRAAEAVLEGSAVDEGAIRAAAQAAEAAARPISDVRGSADYRRQMVGTLTARALRAAQQRAQ